MKITIDVANNAVLSELDRLAMQSSNLQPLLTKIGSGLRTSHALRWDKQESPKGKKWKALSPKYQRWKSKYHPQVANKILVLFGRLKNLKMNIDNDSVIISSDTEYAKAHQYGVPSRNLPKREFLGFSDTDLKFINEEVRKYFS